MMIVVAERVFAALIINSVITGLALIFVLLRLCTRSFITKHIGFDDVLILGALVSLGPAVVHVRGTHY